MFTGIIEKIGSITAVTKNGNNVIYRIDSPISNQLSVDQSVSHDGVCLTVETVTEKSHTVTAISETLSKTNLGTWEIGRKINLERSMRINARFDGHIVQGHVDCTATCRKKIDKNGSTEFAFELNIPENGLIIEKGSITINGISLTLFNVHNNQFTVGIIPYTFNHTNLQYLQLGDIVNIEFDVIGKYVQRLLQK